MMKPNFIKVVRREWPTLLIDMIYRGMNNKSYFKIAKLGFCYKNFKYLDSDCYYDLNEINKLAEIIKGKSKKDENFIEHLSKVCYSQGENLLNISEKIKKADYGNKKNKDLLVKFKKFQNAFEAFMPFIMIPISVEKILEQDLKDFLNKELKSEKFFDDYFIALTTPNKQNIAGKELEAIEKLLKQVLKSKLLKNIFSKSVNDILKKINKFPEFEKDLDRYLSEFAWIGKRNFIGQEWKKEDVIKRIKDLIKKEIKKKQNLISESKKLSDKIIKELKFSKKEKQLVNLVKEFVFLRTHRMDVLNISFYNITNLIEEIAKRFNYSYEDIIYMNSKELGSLERNQLSKGLLLERRRKHYLVVLDGEFQFFIEKDFKKELAEIEKVELVKEIKGSVVNKGKVKGVVKIIFSKRDLDKVKRGDILVASMTTPDYIAAMERATGFITDEGGILCHAAIVSREMNKPCIIGTKIATKVLKDGDLVELNANKRVVKILKK